MPVAIGGSGTVTGLTSLSFTNGTMSGLKAPAFRAFANADQTVTSGVETLVNLASETFDTDSRFNNTGSTVGGIPAYAFMPDQAGYYSVTGYVRCIGTTTGAAWYCAIYKNGAPLSYGTIMQGSSNGNIGVLVNDLVLMNGTTDYIQLYGSVSGTGTVRFDYGNNQVASRFSAHLVRY